MTVDQEVNLTRWLVIVAVVGAVIFAVIALYTFVLDSLLASLLNLLT